MRKTGGSLSKARLFAAFVCVVVAGASSVAVAQGFAKPLPLDGTVPQERELYAKLRIQERYGITFRPYATVCNDRRRGVANCLAKIITDERGIPLSFGGANADIEGYGPKDLRAAYDVPGVAPGRPIIGIVDAYGYSTALSDLRVYSRQFKLPILPKCKGSVADSPEACLQIVNEKGGKKLPTAEDAGWAAEQAIDLQMAHALCENCSILLVEADTDGFSNLMPAESTAAKLGANVISNSWASAETSGDTALDESFFTHPGVAMTAGTGDHGYAAGVSWPASSPNVVAVSGTSLFLSANGKKYGSEVAWAGDGSGCSAFEARPPWQPSLPGCPDNRTVSDIAVDADPNTGVAIYNSDPQACMGTANCWLELGGTSISAPIVAAMFMLAGGIPADSTQAASALYANRSKRNSHDIVSGSNGTCGFAYLCNAVPGYDGPTGLGSPKGLAIFIALGG
jgi:subtilase family serine protease